jgi:DNA polymerase
MAGTEAHLDVESFSRVNLRSAGMWRYWQDDSTELLCLSYALGNGPVKTWSPYKKQPPPDALLQAVQQGHRIVAHNAQFERLAWRWLANRYGWPQLKDAQLRCTAAQAAALALPRALGKVASALGLEAQKDAEGKRLLRKFAQPQRKGNRIMPADDPADFDKLIEYCAQDVRSEAELHYYLPPLSSSEENIWQLDLQINERGLPIDRELILAMKDVAQELQAGIVKRARQLSGVNPTQVEQIRLWCEEQGTSLANLQANNVRNALQRRNLPSAVRELLQLRLEAGRVSVKKLDSALVCADKDDRIRGSVLYHAATTGRWAGKLVQPHNFPRGVYKEPATSLIIDLVLQRNVGGLMMLFANPMEALSSILRGIICASDGHLFEIEDFKAIEARVLVWIADQTDILMLYHGGADLYVHMAANIYRVPPDWVNAVQRKFGKDTVLGCGFQMGVDKFIATCLKNNVAITRELAEKCVYGYRNTYKRVVKLWGEVERAAIRAVSTGKPQHVAKCVFFTADRFLYCRLPSGRKLAYPDPEVKHDTQRNKNQLTYMGQSKIGGWVRLTTYGGHLVENIVQAIARDLMANGMVNAERAGLPVVGTVHDEIITELRQSKAHRKGLGPQLCKLPEWAHGCPIETEGFVAKRYRKG